MTETQIQIVQIKIINNLFLTKAVRFCVTEGYIKFFNGKMLNKYHQLPGDSFFKYITAAILLKTWITYQTTKHIDFLQNSILLLCS